MSARETRQLFQGNEVSNSMDDSISNNSINNTCIHSSGKVGNSIGDSNNAEAIAGAL